MTAESSPARGGDPAGLISMIHVEEDCADLPYTREILDRAAGIPVRFVNGGREFSPVSGQYPHSLSKGKRQLLLCRNRGRFFKQCPGTREYICCGYQVLNIGMNCPMDCTYCILQAYLNNPWLSFFVNVDELKSELDQVFAAAPAGCLRLGTGEFTDSLALDRLTGLSRILVEYMRDRPGAVLELKTKTAVVDNLRDLEHGGRTIVAWSVNSPLIMRRHELHSATLEQRLRAAALCAAWGYRLAFHFDPIIYHQGWEEGYAATISRIFAAVPGESIAWISMGALRFLPSLKKIVSARFAGPGFFCEEFVEGLDGKYRYFRPQRVALYKLLLSRIRKQRVSADTCVYLCMESEEVWQEVFGYTPADRGGLPAMLDRAVF